MKVIYLSIFISIFIVTSCNDLPQEETKYVEYKDSVSSMVDISSEMALDILEQMPSPLEIENMIKKAGAMYNSRLLLPVENADKYATSSQKAITFGVYSADLGYANMYNSTQDIVKYLDVVSNVSKDLGVETCFDYKLLENIILKEGDNDSLMQVSTDNFEKIYQYLATTERGELGALMVTGGWLEAMYLASMVDSKNKYSKIEAEIGDQKLALDKIIELSNLYKANPAVKPIIKRMLSLKILFDNLHIKEIVHDAKIVEEDGMPVYEGKKEVKVEISNSQYKEIQDSIISIRNSFVKVN
ncbi:MAG: hypothetical protein U0V72_02650 [Cytophagales bacterium]